MEELKYEICYGKGENFQDLGSLTESGHFEILVTKKRDVKKLLRELRKAIKSTNTKTKSISDKGRGLCKDFLQFVLDTKFSNGVWHELNSTNTTT